MTNVESIERGALGSYPALPNRTVGCPPDVLLRAAVLETDEAVLSHVVRCGRCMNLYLGALGRDWLWIGHRAH